MKKILTFFSAVFFLLVFFTPLNAQDIPTGKFKGDYYNGVNFDTLVFTREDVVVNFDWWRGSPGPGVARDNFSVRWQGDIEFTAGDWEFWAKSDDGVRIFVDGGSVIDSWKIQSGAVFKSVKNLSAGKHRIVIEYFEKDTWAAVHISWKKLTPAVTAVPTSSARTTPGVVGPTPPPLYGGLYVSSCEELKANPLAGEAPLEVEFSGAGYDPYGEIQNYIFNFGDGTAGAKVTQEDSYASYIYEKPGNYAVTLTIKDSKGNLRTSDVCKIEVSVGGYYKEGVGGYAEPTVYPATASSLPKTGIFDESLSLLLLTIPMAIFGLLLNRKFSKL